MHSNTFTLHYFNIFGLGVCTILSLTLSRIQKDFRKNVLKIKRILLFSLQMYLQILHFKTCYRNFIVYVQRSKCKSTFIFVGCYWLWIFYWYFRKTLTEAFPNFAKDLTNPANLNEFCENSGLLTGIWHNVTIQYVGYKHL
jgi:hypothetical protein